MPADPRVVEVVTAYGGQAAEVRRKVLSFIQRVWGSLDSYRDADIERFVHAVVPIVEGGQVQVAALTDAFLSAVQQAMTGKVTPPVGIPTDSILDLTMRGVATSEVYARSGPAVWTALGKGDDLARAAHTGLQRALSMASTDLQLSKTHASRHVFTRRTNVVGYRRTLTGRKSCGLCIVASTQRYHREDLLPIHPGCDCGVVPIVGDDDPGQVIDPDTLDDVHEQLGRRFGVSDASARGPLDYRSVLVTHEHGEIGPVLAVKGQRFTGPDDL